MKGRTNVGGGKPEEEKTVTAGTSVIEVNPSSGKAMKKVTINPTPTESKSVTPTTSELTVTPSEGKHLSQVVVGAVEDVTPEVTAQTPVITQIAENLGVTITTPSGTNKQILQGNNANLLNINNNAKKEGAYVWKKSYGILPSEYKVVEYIEGTGTQYIDTGFKPNNNTCYEIKYQTIPTQDFSGVMGSEHGWGNTSFALWCKHAGFANSTINNQTWYGASPVTMRFDKGTLYKDGVQVWSASGTFQCNYNAYLFGINRAGTLTEPVDNLKIYYVKIWDNGTLVRDFVPCTKNGIAGLYDRVNNDFYVNKGSGTFSVGEVVSEATNIEYVVSDELNKYPNGGEQGGYWYELYGIPLNIVTWAGGTDEEIVAMVEAADQGLINLSDYWAVGDTRTVQLSAMSATGVGESHAAQQADLVLMHAGGYDLNAAVASGRTKCSFVVGLKDSLKEAGYMNSSNTNSGSWNGSARRTWCNNVFRNAIPSTLRAIFKQFKTVTAQTYDGSTNQTSVDYFALPAEREIFDARNQCNQTEYNALFQFDYYKTASNRVKKRGKTGTSSLWWERSPYYNYSDFFCDVTSSGGAGYDDANRSYGLAPFGCI